MFTLHWLKREIAELADINLFVFCFQICMLRTKRNCACRERAHRITGIRFNYWSGLGFEIGKDTKI